MCHTYILSCNCVRETLEIVSKCEMSRHGAPCCLLVSPEETMLPIQVGPCTGGLLHGPGWMNIKNPQCPYQLRTFGHAAVRQIVSSRTRVPAPSKTISAPSDESAESSQDTFDLSNQSSAPSVPREIPAISEQNRPGTLPQTDGPLAPPPSRTSSCSGAAQWITVKDTAKRPAPPSPRPAPIPDCIATPLTSAVSQAAPSIFRPQITGLPFSLTMDMQPVEHVTVTRTKVTTYEESYSNPHVAGWWGIGALYPDRYRPGHRL